MKEQKTSKFFTYNQNNSGGHFVINKERGIGEYVIVEAMNSNDADARAESIGLYFNGVEDGMDCGCCGDRWYSPYDDGSEEPLIYGQSPEDYKNGDNWSKNKTIAVHYLDGGVKCYDGNWD
jgi:hypothetical protein